MTPWATPSTATSSARWVKRRHGPLDALDYGYPRKPGEGKPPMKKCAACEEQVPIAWETCQHCGFEFQVEPKEIDLQRDEQSKVYAEPEEFEVIGWSCRRWENRTNPEKPNTLRVDYEIRADYGPMLSEWICLNHDGWAGEKAMAWWLDHRVSQTHHQTGGRRSHHPTTNLPQHDQELRHAILLRPMRVGQCPASQRPHLPETIQCNHPLMTS